MCEVPLYTRHTLKWSGLQVVRFHARDGEGARAQLQTLTPHHFPPLPTPLRCQVNSAHTRQSCPDSGHSFRRNSSNSCSFLDQIQTPNRRWCGSTCGTAKGRAVSCKLSRAAGSFLAPHEGSFFLFSFCRFGSRGPGVRILFCLFGNCKPKTNKKKEVRSCTKAGTQPLSFFLVYGLVGRGAALQTLVRRYRANLAHIRQSRPANMAHIRQSRTDSGLGFQVKALKTFRVVLFSLGSG